MSFSLTSQVFIVANEKGGVGKTTVALALADWLTINGHPPTVIQIDRQDRLANAIPDVLTIASDPKATRIAPEEEMRRFNPILDKIESAANQKPILIDVGAGEVGRFATWVALVDLAEDMAEWQLQCNIVVPFLAESEAILQAAWSAERLQTVLPNSMLRFVENRRDGAVSALHPNSAAHSALDEKLKPCYRNGSPPLKFPAIPGNSWRSYEASNCRFITAVDLTTDQSMSRTGLSRADAKIARGDVSQWLLNVFDEFDQTWKIGA
ncbi:hypothetical protein AAKU58_000238 [Oxalobacteraceae bacterium GrIS 1.18]